MADRKIASVLIYFLSEINYHEYLYATVLRNNIDGNMPFPAGKLFYLALKQVARPVSRQLQAFSRNNSFMRRRILVPTGQRKLPYQCLCFNRILKCSLTIL